jgi:pimeloyl-ACP methyl ester carboxylesterase
MSGFSRGAFMMYIYASKYQHLLKGLVILDGVIKDAPPMGTPMDEATFNQLVALFKAGFLVDPTTNQSFPWLNMVSGLDDNTYNSWKLAGVLPYARHLAGAPLPTGFEVISDYVADNVYHWKACLSRPGI